MEKTFETEVLTRLAVIESKLDGYQNIKEKAEESYTISKQNKEDIKDMQDNNKWLWRTAVGSIITSAIGLVFLFIKTGVGVG
jgi:hypothetical protein|nr:MAG TPA: hemolysin [Caudoviricetes sp.]